MLGFLRRTWKDGLVGQPADGANQKFLKLGNKENAAKNTCHHFPFHPYHLIAAGIPKGEAGVWRMIFVRGEVAANGRICYTSTQLKTFAADPPEDW